MQCHHCGREVKETRHTQKGYQVDYYLLHTGATEWAFFKDRKEDAPLLRYLKLTQPIDILTCVDCYANPQIKKRLDDDFKGLISIVGQGQDGNPENTQTQGLIDHG